MLATITHVISLAQWVFYEPLYRSHYVSRESSSARDHKFTPVSRSDRIFWPLQTFLCVVLESVSDDRPNKQRVVAFTLPHQNPCIALFTCGVCYRIKCLVVNLRSKIHVSKTILCVVMSSLPRTSKCSEQRVCLIWCVSASRRKSFLAAPFKYGELKTSTVI